MNHTRTMLKGTLILTLSGFLTKIIGFLYRIFLSQTIGSTGMGIYQLIFPIHALCFALTVGGIQTAISRLVAAKFAKKEAECEEKTKNQTVTNCFLNTKPDIIIISKCLVFCNGRQQHDRDCICNCTGK